MSKPTAASLIAPAVALIVDELTLAEVQALYLAVSLGYRNLSAVKGYDKITPLLTEAGHTAMHEEARNVFLAMAAQRIEWGR